MPADGSPPVTSQDSTAACPFCDYAGPSEILSERDGVFFIEPMNPATKGHVLAIPREHVANAVERPDVFAQVAESAAHYIVERGVGPCNIITSHGLAATQTVFHLHVHIVPRRAGDGLTLPWSAA